MFFDKFSELCSKKGISPSAALDDLKISRGNISNWKQNGAPRQSTLLKISNYFGVTPDYFSDDKEEIHPMMIPVYGQVSAGTGILAEDLITGYEMAPQMAEGKDCFYLSVHGDSMKPKLEDGDLVLVHKQESVEPGEIAVLLVDGEDGVVKRVDYDENSITLLSFNPFYQPRIFEGTDVRRVSVLAKVVMMMRRF